MSQANAKVSSDYASLKNEFLLLFNSIGKDKHRYQIFNDFVLTSVMT